MIKRMISLLLAAVLAFGAVAPAAVRAEAQEVVVSEETIPVETTTDPTESTAETDPTEATEPEPVVTRGQWLSLLVNTFGYSIDTGVTLDDYYTDLYSDHEYYEDIMTAVYYGLVDVLPNNPMQPDESTTREFAAYTLNSCMGGFPSGETYDFSEAETATYPDDIQVAIERGWFALSEGAFLPEKAITEAERDGMIADAEAYLESLIIDESHENGYTFKEGVVEITDYAEIEFGDGTSVIRIYDISQPLAEGDTFVVYSDGLAIPFRADAISATAEYTEVTATDLYFQDAIETMDVQMVTDADPLNFAPAEGAELVFIEEESGEEVTAEYASYAMDRGIKKIFIPKFTKTIKLSEHSKIDIEVEFKNAKLNYNTKVEVTQANLSVWLDGDADVTTKLSSEKEFFDPIEIPVGTYEVPGVGGIGLYLKSDVTGSISMVMKTKMKLGVSMTWRPFLPAPIVTSICDSKPYSSSINADITAKIYLECKIGFYGKALPLKGYLFGEAGFKANVKYTTYQEITGHCTHFAAYFYAEYGAKVSWEIIGETELEFKPDDKYMITEKNSPIKYVKHYEDGVERSKCTREDLSGTTTGSPSALIDSGYVTGGSSSSGLSSGSSTSYDSDGNVVTLYTYTLDEDKNATITKYNGNAASLSIPTSLDGYPVVAIGGSAFSGKTSLQTVIMPDSITAINYNAFYNCTSLRNISFPSGLTSIGGGAFYGCTALTTVSIPDSVTTIYNGAFANCGKLQYVKLPKNLKTLYYQAFENCDSLKSVTIPKSLETVGRYSSSSSSGYWNYEGPFRNCDNLSSIAFEAETTQVVDWLFANCPGLRSATLPDTITTVGSYAFYKCDNLTSVTFGDAVTTVGSYAFYSNGNLTDVKLNENLITIGSYAFGYCTALQGIEIPNTVTTINPYAFECCTALEAIVFPDSVTRISSFAFRNCSALADVTLSANLQTLESAAFYNCDNLTSIHIPKSLTGCSYPFQECNNLETVTFEEGIETIPAYLFQYCNGLISIEIPETVTTIGYCAFAGASDLASITLPEGLTTIDAYAFKDCVALPAIEIPDSVTSIGGYCFYGCTSLTDVKLSGNITAIESYTFYTCTVLKEIWIPDGVTSIGAEAFAGCYLLETVHLPKSLETLGCQAFRTCDGLKTIEIPKNLKTVTLYRNSNSSSYWSYQGPFRDCDNLTEVTFEEGATKVVDWLFANCPGLKEITLPDTITEIGGYAFHNCNALANVSMGDAVTTIGSYTFYGCEKLAQVRLSDNLTTIGSYTFQSCTGLPALAIPDCVTTIGGYAFDGCTALAEVNLPKALTSLGYYAFRNCDSLTAINIPKALGDNNYAVDCPFAQCDHLADITFEEGITKIPYYLFQKCYGLVDMAIPETVTSIGAYAFENCVNLESITIPDTVTNIGSYAFQGCTSLKAIHWPEAATTICSYTFQNCDSLTDITLPEGLVTIETYAFQDCDTVVSFNMPDSVTTLGTYAFQDCSLLEHIHLSESLTALPIYAFQNCDALKDIVIPDSVTTIGNAVFYDCDALTTVTMGDAVTTMGTHVFYHNDVLESVELSMQLTSIPQYSFYTCPKLTEIVIPYYVTTIDSYAFNASPKLAKVVTRSNLTSIASNAFSYPNVTVFHGDAGSYTETWADTNGYGFVANEVAATAVTLSPRTLSIAKGSTAQLYMTVTPADHSEVVTFKSSDETVATVDAAGKITARAVGTTTIKVMVGSASASCKVTVTQAITSLALDKTTLALDVPNTYQLVATIKPTDASNQILQWTSSNEDTATVDETGLITAVGNGTAVITATTTDGTNFSKSCTVTVTDPNNIPVTKITLSKTAASMEALETLQLTATMAPTTAANQGVLWSSSDETVAMVDETGLVTAYGKGTAVITATAADGFGAEAACTVTVINTAHIVTDPGQLESSHDYETDCHDYWIYTAEGAAALIVTFDEKTSMEEDFDFLHIYDGEGTLVGSYTGTALAGQSVEILGDTLRIRLDSDGSGTEWGFRVSGIEVMGHIHNYVPTVTAPTCTEGGYTIYSCTECDLSYTADETEAIGHKYADTVTAPTCTEPGSTTHICSNCGDTYTDAETEALGHDLHHSQTIYPATCTEDGKAVYTCSRCIYSEMVTLEAPGHSYTETVTPPTCTEGGYTTCVCSVCGHTCIEDEVDALGHSFSQWITEGAVQTRTCEACGLGETYCLEHSFGDWTVTDAATCTQPGNELRECAGCGLAELQEIPATGHSYSETVTAPTCTEPGGTMFTCGSCGDSYADDKVEALGHTVEGGICTRCETVFVRITAQPENVEAADGEIVRVEVKAEGQGLTYAWYYKNVGSTKFSRTTAFRGGVYSMAMNGLRSGRQIYCVITDENGYSVTTDTVTLNMAVTPLEILRQPVNAEAEAGEMVEVSVEAVGDGLTYEWYFRNAGGKKFSKTASFTGPTYYVTMSEARSGRQVYCVITDQHGSSVTTNTVTLTMTATPLEIVTQPADVTVAEGEIAGVSVEATGDGLTYEWYFKNAGGKKFSKTASFTGPSYYVSMNEARDRREVYCVITDKYGASVTTETVTLYMEVPTVLEIITQPESVSVAAGEMAEVRVEAVGEQLTYEWYFMNAGGTKFTKTSSFTGNTYSVAMSATRSGRQVYCVITDKYGNSVQTDTVTLSLVAAELEILTQPESVTLIYGETGTLTVEAVGDGLTYEWYYKNAGSSAFSKTSSFTGSTYTLTMNASRSGRHVYCVITDAYGNSVTTDIVTLNMVSELELLSQPEDTSAASGETAVITADAVGDDLTYTWYYRNAGAEAFTRTDSFTGDTYSLKMTATRSGRQVYCVITDGIGNTVATDIVTLSMA